MGLAAYIEQLYVKATVPDPRTQDWLLVPSIWPTVVIVVVYLIVIIGGQRVMKHREALRLNEPMKIYNFCLVLLNAYIFLQFLVSSWLNFSFSKVCHPVEMGVNNSDTMSIQPITDVTCPLGCYIYTLFQLANAVWWFYFSKSIELMDTVFFMLRKKNSQISFLHLYHHSTMPLIWWIGVKYAPGGESYFSSSINSGIHILMYSYYLLSAMGPQYQKYLWWKRYMTVMQLIQFWAILFHTSYAIYIDCGYPLLYCWALLFYVFTHIALFSNFYYQTYTRRKPKRTSVLEQNGVVTGQENDVANTHRTESGVTRRPRKE